MNTNTEKHIFRCFTVHVVYPKTFAYLYRSRGEVNIKFKKKQEPFLQFIFLSYKAFVYKDLYEMERMLKKFNFVDVYFSPQISIND